MSNQIQKLVDRIQFELKLTHEQIAADIGYSRPYFTNALKKGTSKKLINALRETYNKRLQNSTGQTVAATVDAGKQISENIEDIIGLKARVNVLKSIVAAFASEKKGTSIAKEILEIDKVCDEQADRLFSEWKRKHK